VALHFPVEAEMPEHLIHFELRTALYQLIKLAMSERVIVGSDQFVYWEATDPRKCLAPDVLVWVGAPHAPFGVWKVWERGAPHVAVEIVSPHDAPQAEWEEKLSRYRQCGVPEVVRFDPQSKSEPLRIWDRLQEDLVERDLTAPGALSCDALALFWCVKHDAVLGPVLRLARDEAGTDLLPLPDERIRELEAELAKRSQR